VSEAVGGNRLLVIARFVVRKVNTERQECEEIVSRFHRGPHLVRGCYTTRSSETTGSRG
jgi:hypothetical protein